VLLATATALAAAYGFVFIKFMTYGVWIGLVPLVIALVRLPALGETPARTVRIGAVVLANQLTMLTFAGALVSASSTSSDATDRPLTAHAAACALKSDIACLRNLPPGLVVSNLDLGPYIAVASGHRVVAGAPMTAFTARSDACSIPCARRLPKRSARVRGLKADYVVLCAASGKEITTGEAAAKPATFSKYLRSGGTLPYLKLVNLGPLEGLLKVWKLSTAS
jgi:hypothetical protein